MTDVPALRLCLIISSLGSGGAERVLAQLANHWAEAGHHVSVLTLSGPEKPIFHTMAQEIHLRQLGVAENTIGIFAKITKLIHRRQTLRTRILAARPHVVISFLDTTNILTLLATRGLELPVIVCERTDPTAHDPGLFWRLLRRLCYPNAARIVVQTQAVFSRLSTSWRKRTIVIPNPIPHPGNAQLTPPPLPRPVLLTVGRFTWEKGHDLLLGAFSRVTAAHPAWQLAILGDGPCRSALEAQTETLGLKDRVHFMGLVNNVSEYMFHADAFVLPSRYEGFPNALCEAMACGLPCIAFDCPSGPSEIIRHKIDGLLVSPGDISALALAMDDIMGNPEYRADLAARAPEICDRFSEHSVFSQWDSLVCETASPSA
ncbi:MAG: glycosyltransferase family 4 protein [Proteobacteria bacterium]|nr:glycosyltransferase family 4 protein [Pseudomonadota bacterium]MBU1610729.1 glycosyltransferase family 4 protein [Pseudomonadota bacterium]